MAHKTILYFPDKMGVTEGYRATFNRILAACKIPPQVIIYGNVHAVVSGATMKKGNQIEWVGNPDRYDDVKRYVDHMIQTSKPDILVTSCPSVLAVFNQQTAGASSISLTRGSLYTYVDRPALIVPPVSAIHRQNKTKDVDSLSDSAGIETDGDVYKIKDGHWFLVRDWSKVGRVFTDSIRKFPTFEYSIVRHTTELATVEDYLSQCALISIDVETTGSQEAGGACISCVGYTGLHKSGDMRTFVIPFADKFKYGGMHWDSDYEMGLAIQSMQRINALPVPKTMQNGSYDCAYFITYAAPTQSYVLDTMHMWHSLYPELSKSLDVIASILLDNYAYWKQDLKGLKEEGGGRRDTSMERFWRYNALDCYYTMCSTLLLYRLVSGMPKIRFNFANEFMQMLGGLTMTLRGMKADFPRREEHRQKLQQEYDEAQKRLQFLIGDPNFNVNSSQQKVELLYDLLGAKPRDAKGQLIKNASGKGRSAGKYALKMIRSEHPFFKKIIDVLDSSQEPLKQISNVCDMTVNGPRVRSSISVRTETWRYSSSSSPFWDGTNLQNIRKSMRDWMIADEGCILFDVDYSQSDAVFVAYESNDSNYIETMTSGRDSHAIHGEFFFKMPYDKIIQGKKADDPLITHPITGIRNITKRIVHGANFQMAGMTLYVSQMGKEATVFTARQMGFPSPDTWTEAMFAQFCQKLLNMFRGRYPRLSKNGWYGEIAKLLETERMITNAFGMTRSFIGDPKDPATQREATAFYGQSDTAGNMNRTLEEILYGYVPPTFRDGPNEYAKTKPLQLDNPEYGMKMLLQVHDSLIGQISTRAPRWKEGLHNLLTVMERPVTINGHRAIVKTEAEIGKYWGKSMIPWRLGDPYDLDRISAITR